MKLLWRIVVAMALGIGAGYIVPVWGVRVFTTFNGIFSQFLGFLIPLLILGYVAPAIAEIGSKAGRMLCATAAIAYAMTLASGWFSFGVGAWLFPQLIKTEAPVAALDSDTVAGLTPYFAVDMPPLFGVMSALVLSFLLGLGMAYTGSSALRRGFDEFRTIISKTVVAVIIPLLPLYIFGIFMAMTVEGQVGRVLLTFISIIAVIFGIHVLVLLAQFCIAGAVGRRNPLTMLRTMLPAYFTALGTQSSAATIPVTLRRVKALGVDEPVAGFVVPLCATIHMSGSALKITACALAILFFRLIPERQKLFAVPPNRQTGLPRFHDIDKTTPQK